MNKQTPFDILVDDMAVSVESIHNIDQLIEFASEQERLLGQMVETDIQQKSVPELVAKMFAKRAYDISLFMFRYQIVFNSVNGYQGERNLREVFFEQGGVGLFRYIEDDITLERYDYASENPIKEYGHGYMKLIEVLSMQSEVVTLYGHIRRNHFIVVVRRINILRPSHMVYFERFDEIQKDIEKNAPQIQGWTDSALGKAVTFDADWSMKDKRAYMRGFADQYLKMQAMLTEKGDEQVLENFKTTYEKLHES